jgi:hypothetical protein
MSVNEPFEAWAPWHPEYGFQDEFMDATWVSSDLDDIAQRVKRLNKDDKTNSRNGWRAVKVTLSRVLPAAGAKPHSEDTAVNLTTLLGTLRFYSKFNGEIPRHICGEAADEIERLQALGAGVGKP